MVQKKSTKSSSSSVLLPFCFVSRNILFSSSSWAHLCFAKARSALTDFSSRSRSFALAVIALATWKNKLQGQEKGIITGMYCNKKKSYTHYPKHWYNDGEKEKTDYYQPKFNLVWEKLFCQFSVTREMSWQRQLYGQNTWLH